MSLEPPLMRARDAVEPRPFPKTPRNAALAQRQKQRRLIWSAAATAALIAGGWFVYSYISTAPERARIVFDRGMGRMGPGTYQDAVSLFNRAIVIWPAFAEAYLNRAIAERNLGREESAVSDLEKASDLDPNLARAYDERGRIYLAKGDTRRALAEFTKSIHIQPTTDGYYQRGLTYEAVGEHRKAVADYNDAIAVIRDAPYAYRARALAKDALGDAEGARADRQTAQRIESH